MQTRDGALSVPASVINMMAALLALSAGPDSANIIKLIAAGRTRWTHKDRLELKWIGTVLGTNQNCLTADMQFSGAVSGAKADFGPPVWMTPETWEREKGRRKQITRMKHQRNAAIQRAVKAGDPTKAVEAISRRCMLKESGNRLGGSPVRR